MKRRHMGMGLAAWVVVTGCGGATPPPRELDGAHAALEYVEGTDAVSLAPAEIALAKAAVGHADEAAKRGESEAVVRDLALAATSRVGLAEARAGEVRAHRQAAAAREELGRVQLSQREEALAHERDARVAAEMKARAQVDRLAKLANVTKGEGGYMLTMPAPALFEGNQAKLAKGACARLDEVVAVLKEMGSPKVEVSAFVDSAGSAKARKDVTTKRADAVRDCLVLAKIPPERVVARGRGSESPVAEERTAEGRAKNRRVELVVVAPLDARDPARPREAP